MIEKNYSLKPISDGIWHLTVLEGRWDEYVIFASNEQIYRIISLLGKIPDKWSITAKNVIGLITRFNIPYILVDSRIRTQTKPYQDIIKSEGASDI